MNTLRSSLGLDLPGTLIYDYPTISALTNHIVSFLHMAGTEAAISQSTDVQGGQPTDLDLKTDKGASRDLPKALDSEYALHRVQAVVLDILGLEMGIEQPFSAAGLDSLAAVEVSNSLNR